MRWPWISRSRFNLELAERLAAAESRHCADLATIADAYREDRKLWQVERERLESAEIDALDDARRAQVNRRKAEKASEAAEKKCRDLYADSLRDACKVIQGLTDTCKQRCASYKPGSVALPAAAHDALTVLVRNTASRYAPLPVENGLKLLGVGIEIHSREDNAVILLPSSHEVTP